MLNLKQYLKTKYIDKIKTIGYNNLYTLKISIIIDK